MTRGPITFQEERTPCGAPGLRPVYVRSTYQTGTPADYLADCLVSRPKPWILIIWEPLCTKAPAPPKAAPYCCYIQTVIFYHSPYIKRPWSRLYRNGRGALRAESPGSFEQWDKIETRLTGGDVVAFEAEEFEIGGGQVVWAKGRWWMGRGARRKQVGAA